MTLCLLAATHVVHADEVAATSAAAAAPVQGKIAALIDKGFGFLGVRYRSGGNGPEAGGFDCSGLVRKVFGDALGLNLPRTAAEMAQLGDKVGTQELKPGDLVFFNTMRRAFSHVGIYVGDNKFIHSPSKGSAVRVENMDETYWAKRFSGGRRLLSEAQASPLPASVSPAVSSMAAAVGSLVPPPLLARPPEQTPAAQ